MEDNMIAIFERTLNNCEFYKDEGKEAHLLNEIGVLRGIAYCIEAAVGEYNLPRAIEFHAMIAEQNRLLKDAEQEA